MMRLWLAGAVPPGVLVLIVQGARVYYDLHVHDLHATILCQTRAHSALQ